MLGEFVYRSWNQLNHCMIAYWGGLRETLIQTSKTLILKLMYTDIWNLFENTNEEESMQWVHLDEPPFIHVTDHWKTHLGKLGNGCWCHEMQNALGSHTKLCRKLWTRGQKTMKICKKYRKTNLLCTITYRLHKSNVPPWCNSSSINGWAKYIQWTLGEFVYSPWEWRILLHAFESALCN